MFRVREREMMVCLGLVFGDDGVSRVRVGVREMMVCLGLVLEMMVCLGLGR